MNSKIQFESQSQQRLMPLYVNYRCLSWIQRYNLKANHNLRITVADLFVGAYHEFKDTIWKPITTNTARLHKRWPVLIMNSKIQFESQSQLASALGLSERRCLSWIQRYNLKANHNIRAIVSSLYSGAYHEFKDTIWKPITTDPAAERSRATGAYHEFKDTIWKPITTNNILNTVLRWVLIMNSKIQFESQSQPTGCNWLLQE